MQVSKTRDGFRMGQFQMLAGLIRVKTGKSLGIVNEIRILVLLKINVDIANQHL